MAYDYSTQYNQGNNDIWDMWKKMLQDYGADNQAISAKNNQLWDTMYEDKTDMSNRYSKLEDFNYSNPFESETGKSILARYDLAGLQGRDNQAALGGADNGGNIDSYSAANALRQQAALRNLGEQTALAAHSRTVSDGRGIIGDRTNYLQGIYNQMTGAIDSEIKQNNANSDRLLNLFNTGMTQNQRLFDNDQTTKNNALNREILTSQTTGNVPTTMLMREYGLIDEYGNLTNVNIDYHAKINALNQKLANTTDQNARQEIQNQIAAYTAARNVKIGMSEYQKYANDMVGSYYAPVANADTNQFNAQSVLQKYQIDTNADLTRQGYDLDKYRIDTNKETTLKGYDLEKYKVDTNKEISMKELDANIDYNKANLEWQKEYGKLEMDYKNKALSQEAANFALSIGKERYIAELNASVSKDANSIQRELIASNERIAKIEAQSRDYATNSNENIALDELKKKEEQFKEELEQRNADRTETARQFNATLAASTGNTGTGQNTGEKRDIGGKDITFAMQRSWIDGAGETVTIDSNKAFQQSKEVQTEYNKLLNDYANGKSITKDDIWDSMDYLISSGISEYNPLIMNFYQYSIKNLTR